MANEPQYDLHVKAFVAYLEWKRFFREGKTTQCAFEWVANSRVVWPYHPRVEW